MLLPDEDFGRLDDRGDRVADADLHSLDGSVEQLRVLRSGNPLLDRAVLDAVARWRYKPATWNGRAVSVYLTVTVTFGLKS